MTSVKFLKSDGKLCGFSLNGHSTASCDDFDGKLVCAAISSAAYMTANTVTEIIGDECEIKVSDADMYLFAKNPSKETVACLNGFKLHLTELQKQYGKRIEIITEV